ncbi:Ig-like domain-containing protein, partial [Chitinimonas sp.]|uniref:Ig-like domain-containing protein n=1 Tax=Chitinimonas sp. TaxID=1934313 RepID=UPI002F93F610
MNKKHLAVLVMTLGLAACGGGGGDSSATTPPAAPFTVSSTLPAAGATGVARNGTVTVTFSTAVNAASVSSSSVQLLGPLGNVIPSQAVANGTTLTITPTAKALPGDTQYTVKLASTLADTMGRQLGTAQ